MRLPGLPTACFQQDRFVAETSLFASGPLLCTASGNSARAFPLPLCGLPMSPGHWDGLVLEMSNLSDQPVSFGLRLVHAGPGQPESFTGGREVLPPFAPVTLFFPWGNFGSYGQPGGMGPVLSVEVAFRREKGSVDPLRLRAEVTGLRAVKRAPLTGPRLTPEGLALALDRPFKASLAPKTFPAFASSKPLLDIPPPVFPYPLGTRAQVLAGRIMGHDVGLPPDWEADPMGELEWRHYLHRHHFLRVLARADGLSATCAAAVLEDWIVRNPVPVESGGGAGPAWETLSVAWRLREWMYLLAVHWNHPGFPASARERILRSVWEQARHLRDHRGHPGNWRLLEAATLALAGLIFPEFHEAGQWASEGLARLEAEALAQFLPDGLHVERSPLYHALCAQACLEVYLACGQTGAHFPSSLARELPRWFEALALLARPDRTWPSLNDSAGVDRDYRPLLRLARVVGQGKRQRAPAASLFAQAGVAVLRGQGLWVLFKAGPLPPAHAHADDMSLELCLDGKPVLVDPGITRYAPSDVTTAYRSAAAHSCLFSEALSGRAGPIAGPIECMEGSGVQAAWAARRVEDMLHTREVCRVGHAILVVRDTLAGRVRAPVHVHWQFAPGRLELDGPTGGAQGEGFALVLLAGRVPFEVQRREGEHHPPAGFVSRCGRDVPAPRLEYRFAPRSPCRLLWVFHTGGAVRRTRGGLAFDRDDGSVLRLGLAPWSVRVIPARNGSG